MNLQENVPLAPLTTLGVGGVARYFVTVTSIADVQEALSFAREKSLKIFVLGGGSNIVVSDNGFDGLVIVLKIMGIQSEERGDKTTVTVGAGEIWDDFVVWSIENKLSGLECLSGVPGTVGGAVVANLGAYGAQCSDTLVHAEVIDTESRGEEIKVMKKEDCNFSYHDSIFGHENGRYIVVRATFALSGNPAASPSYRDNRFDMAALTNKLGHAPTQRDVRDAVLSMREEKGNLIMKDRLSYKSVGSFFHMPFVSEAQYAEIEALARSLDVKKEEQLRPWAWKQSDGTYKIAPGFLLEYTEFQKGYSRGSVGVSPRHTLSIINRDGASASDVTQLALDMQHSVKNIFGISLEREVEYVGFA